MNTRLLLRASVLGLLAASLVAGSTAALASQPASAPQISPATSPGKVNPLEVAGLIISVYSVIKECATDASGGQWWECITGSFTGPSIQDVLNRIDQLEQTIDQNHVEVMSRLGQLENAVKQVGLQDRMEDLKLLGNNGDDAMRAWQALTACLQAQSNGQPQCADYTGAQRPTRDAVRDTSEQFLRIVDRWQGLDLPTVVADFAGGGGRQGIAEAAWDYFRTKQHNNAGVEAGNPVRASNRTPVVTHALAAQMNSITSYYAGLITRYAFLSAMADGMRSSTQLNCGSTPLAQCRESRVRAWQDEASRWIDGQGRYQLTGALNHYAMPDVPTEAIAVASSIGSGGSRALYYGGSGGSSGLPYERLADLAYSLNEYGTASAIGAAYPGSFPSGGWYAARMPIKTGDYEVYACRYYTSACTARKYVRVVAPGVGPSTCLVRGRLRDDEASWNTDYQEWMRAKPKPGTAEDLWVDIAGSEWAGWYIPYRRIWEWFSSGSSLQPRKSLSRWVGWDWDTTHNLNGYSFGWGGSVKCTSNSQSSFTLISTNSDYPLFGRP